MDNDHRKGTLCGLLAAGLRVEGLLRVAIERPAAEAEVAAEIREAFELYCRIFEQAWPEVESTPEPENEPEPETCCDADAEVELAAEIQAVQEPEPETCAEEVPAAAELCVEKIVEVQSEPSEEPQCEVRPLSGNLKVDELLARKESADLRRAFTLNDKFRFRRTLFAGSDERFSQVLDALEQLSRYEEAESYMAEAVDPEIEEYEDFMAIVKAHFGSRL